MKELQKIWANKYVRYGALFVVVAVVAYILWKRHQNKKAKEEETKPAGNTDTSKPGKDGTMMSVTERETKPQEKAPGTTTANPAKTKATATATKTL